ncbi:uncharacterized protein LOC143047087 [Mytilus galloprovincialis]|uniref:uncharacterized protein LOC143047087 n=1 Tax=Mytilus galloprovincialis TaxID=29158 RepID=UPI003F7C0E14
MFAYIIIYVILWSCVLKGIVSETCLDVRHVNYTIKCHFDVCKIPGQFCDYSDDDFPRCANCDQDKCNEANIPGECTIPCIKYRHVYDNLTKIIDKCKEDNTFWKTDNNAKTFFGVMVFSLTANILLIIWFLFRSSTQDCNKDEEKNSPITQPVNDDQPSDMNIATSKSTSEITELKCQP